MPHVRLTLVAVFALTLVVGCDRKPTTNPDSNTPLADARKESTRLKKTNANEPVPEPPANAINTSLADARKGFTTKLERKFNANEPVPEPPANVFRTVQYESPAGKLAAYVSPNPKDSKKHPAIIWITGGDCNTIGEVWNRAPRSNDQSASQYREAGLVMMFPSLRGGNKNPGSEENFYGEVDDVLAAADYLAKLDYVDPSRIYLGGHSTGGTLVLLVAEMPNKFRAVFSFGPAHDIMNYPEQFIPAVNTSDAKEVKLRSPGHWLDSIQNPTFVFQRPRPCESNHRKENQ
jgi:dipeptidyl aminopeptidase/acylaminoacyl peptidase